MLQPERLPMTEGEATKVDDLITEHGPGSLSRRDAGETGPIVFSTHTDQTFHIYDDHYEEV